MSSRREKGLHSQCELNASVLSGYDDKVRDAGAGPKNVWLVLNVERLPTANDEHGIAHVTIKFFKLIDVSNN